MGNLCYTTVLTNASTPLVSRVVLYDASTSSGYSVAALLTSLLCRVQPIAAQSILSRRWSFNVLLRHTLFTPITLIFLGPLPNKLIPEEYDRPPRTPTTVTAYQLHEKASNASTQRVRASRAQGTGRAGTRASSRTRRGEEKTTRYVEETESEQWAQERRRSRSRAI